MPHQGVAGAGIDLFSQAASRQVSSALLSLTSVFGMGTGGTSALYTPAIGDPCGNRTRVTGVRGRCLDRLTNGPGTASSSFARAAPPTAVHGACQPHVPRLVSLPRPSLRLELYKVCLRHIPLLGLPRSCLAAGLVRHQGLEPGTR